MKNLFLGAAVAAAFLGTSAKAETINCTEITTVPVVLTAQGSYCLKSDKSSSLTSGNIIDIQANNVTIDLNGFKLGGLGAGLSTSTVGIQALNRQNITIRNGSVRGFSTGILLEGVSSSGHLVEDVLFDTNRSEGIEIQGSGNVVRNNRVVNTGPSDSDNFTNAAGIVVAGRNVVVADNIISGTSETSIAEGIILSAASLVEVRNNTILDTKDGTSRYGINVTGGLAITVIGNRILNTAGTGTAGIIDAGGSTGVNCIGNTVAGFTTALPGCDFVSGNVTP